LEKFGLFLQGKCPDKRLAIYKSSPEKLDKLSQALQMSRHDDTFAAEYLKRYTHYPGISRFAASSTTAKMT